ncbi:MAG: Gfo/Idh/MocA family oxidoreductase, partial [Chloroflexi bacterium]|nr:Gfo/Idh/MocA family oxidoreductase [Chloroflexota bacterium]
RYIAGQEVLEVTAFTDSTSDVASNERTAQAMLKMEGGCIGSLVVTRRAPFTQVEVIAHGTEGTLVCSNTFSFLTRTGRVTGQPQLEITTTKGVTVQEFAAANCFTAEIESFNRAISMDEEPTTSGREGLINQAINEAIYESNRTGRVTRISPDR